MALRWRCCRGLRSSACPPCSATLCVSSPGSYFANHFIMGGEKFDSTHPEGYLFGENSDLNFLGNRPVVVGISGSGLCLLSVCPLSILHEGRDSQALGVGPVDSLVSNIKADRLLLSATLGPDPCPLWGSVHLQDWKLLPCPSSL